MPRFDLTYPSFVHSKTWVAMSDAAEAGYTALDSTRARAIYDNPVFSYAVDADFVLMQLGILQLCNMWVVGGNKYLPGKYTFEEVLFVHKYVNTTEWAQGLYSSIYPAYARVLFSVYDCDPKGNPLSEKRMWGYNSIPTGTGDPDLIKTNTLQCDVDLWSYWYDHSTGEEFYYGEPPDGRTFRACFGTPCSLSPSYPYPPGSKNRDAEFIDYAPVFKTPKGIDPETFGITVRYTPPGGGDPGPSAYGGRILLEHPVVYIYAPVQVSSDTFLHLHHDKMFAKSLTVLSGIKDAVKTFEQDTPRTNADKYPVTTAAMMLKQSVDCAEYVTRPSGDMTLMVWLEKGTIYAQRVKDPFGVPTMEGDKITVAENTGYPTTLVTKNTLWCLYWKEVTDPKDAQKKRGLFMVRASLDGGKTWSEERQFFPDIKDVSTSLPRQKADLKETGAGHLLFSYLTDLTKDPTLLILPPPDAGTFKFPGDTTP